MWRPDQLTPSGETYAEIDRRQEDYVQQVNAALRLLPHAGARWWNYCVSHRTFEIVVGEPFGSNIFLRMAACEFVMGPVQWKNQRLTIIWTNAPPEGERLWHFILVDDSAGFRAEAGCFSWFRDANLIDKDNGPQNTGEGVPEHS